MKRKPNKRDLWHGSVARTCVKLSPRAVLPAAILTTLFLLAGCAALPAWMSNYVGGEGKMAERVSASIIDQAPVETAAVPAREAAVPTREEVVAVQRELAKHGYDPGPADGVAGARTRAAIIAYQKDSGLKADGMITKELADRLAVDTVFKKPAKPASAVADKATAPTAPEAVSKPEPEVATVAPPRPAVEESAEPAEAPLVVKNADVPPQNDQGDTYIWSNGRVETVAGLVGRKLYWRVDNDVRFTADRNFLIPPASWQGPSGTGEAVTQIDPATAWPLTEGSPLNFEVVNNGIRETWHCEAQGGRQVTVPAGKFEAVSLSCQRDSAPDGEWVRRQWLYAPSVRYYVERIDHLADGTRILKKLLGVRPGAEDWPPAVRAGLDRAVQDALDKLPDGAKSVWTSTVVRGEFEIRAGAVRDVDGQARCRNFELVAKGADVPRRYPALACKANPGAEWRIPGDIRNRGILSALRNMG